MVSADKVAGPVTTIPPSPPRSATEARTRGARGRRSEGAGRDRREERKRWPTTNSGPAPSGKPSIPIAGADAQPPPSGAGSAIRIPVAPHVGRLESSGQPAEAPEADVRVSPQGESIRRPEDEPPARPEHPPPLGQGGGRVVEMFNDAVGDHARETRVRPGQGFGVGGREEVVGNPASDERSMRALIEPFPGHDEPPGGDVHALDVDPSTSRREQEPARAAADLQDAIVVSGAMRPAPRRALPPPGCGPGSGADAARQRPRSSRNTPRPGPQGRSRGRSRPGAPPWPVPPLSRDSDPARASYPGCRRSWGARPHPPQESEPDAAQSAERQAGQTRER